jgi:hypothetical protein
LNSYKAATASTVVIHPSIFEKADKMVPTTVITVAAAALLAAVPVNAGLYSKNSPVMQVDAKNYDRLIAQSNYTSVMLLSPLYIPFLHPRK